MSMKRSSVFFGLTIPLALCLVELFFLRNRVDAPWQGILLLCWSLVVINWPNRTYKKMFSSGIYWFKRDEDFFVLEGAYSYYRELIVIYFLTSVLFCIVGPWLTRPYLLLLPVCKVLLMLHFRSKVSLRV